MQKNKLTLNIKKLTSSILKFDFEKQIRILAIKNIHNIKLFFIIFAIVIIVYGNNIFFYHLSNDDYFRFYNGGLEQASNLGRWMATIFNHYIFSGSIHVLPYINGVIGLFSITLASFITAKFWNRTNNIEVAIITLLIATTPFFARNFFFHTNISLWITTLFGIIGLVLAYRRTKLFTLLGLILLIISIGSYQTIVQVTIAIVFFKTIFDILDVNSSKEIKEVLFRAFYLISFIFVAFAISTYINHLYLDYYDLAAQIRYKRFENIEPLVVYINRIIKMYSYLLNSNFKLFYFVNEILFFYKLIAILGVFATYIIILKKDISTKTKMIYISLFTLLFALVPIIINLVFITGNGIPNRSHYTIGWIIAGFFILQRMAFKDLFKTITFTLSIIVIIINIYYMNVFFDAMNRQTNSDITRANQIVNRIRMHNNYTSEPIKFKIIGVKTFPVIGWHHRIQAFNSKRSKYKIFEIFTDLKFTKMTNKEYDDMFNNLAKSNYSLEEYPAKNSIIVQGNNVVLFLNLSKKK